MKTLMISSAIAVALAASAFSVNAQVVAPAANNIVVAQNTNPLLKKKVLGTSGTIKAVASNTGDDDSNENERGEGSEGGEGGEGAGGDHD